MKLARLLLTALWAVSSSVFAVTFTVTPNPANQTVGVGDAVQFDVDLTSVPANASNGMTLVLYYDSSQLTPVNDGTNLGVTNVFSTDLLGVAAPAADAADDDGNPATDQKIAVTWTSLGGNWPGASPQTLLRANFTAAAPIGAPGTAVNFTASGAAGDTFTTNPANIVINATVAVPDVSSTHPTVATATATLNGAGLTANVLPAYNDATVAANRVITQSPAAGTVVPVPSAVDLRPSLGPVSVPNVVGLTQAAAVTAITGAPSVPDPLIPQISSTFSGTVPAGTVISQTPGAGSPNVGPGSIVQILVSLGPAPAGGGASGVPTLSEWALILLAMLVALVAWKRYEEKA